MIRSLKLAVAAALLAPSAAIAGASGFALVNASGVDFSSVSIRRTGAADWRTLGAAPANGVRAAVAFEDPDCAFDIRASLTGGGEAVWRGVNLCEVKSVTLRRGPSGAPFVDYD